MSQYEDWDSVIGFYLEVAESKRYKIIAEQMIHLVKQLSEKWNFENIVFGTVLTQLFFAYDKSPISVTVGYEEDKMMYEIGFESWDNSQIRFYEKDYSDVDNVIDVIFDYINKLPKTF